MASAIMSSIASPAAAFAATLASKASTRSSFMAGASLKPSVGLSLAAPLRTRGGTRCEAGKDPLGGIKEAVSGTKVDLSESDIQRNMEKESEKKSAMLGFAWSVITENTTHKPILDQIKPGEPGLFWVLTLTQLIVVASLIPIFNGESTDSRANGPFTGRAERWNGRLAMVGFAGILLWEAALHKAFLAPTWLPDLPSLPNLPVDVPSIPGVN
eukprot:jgi/Mesen1/8489/ME000480S07843